MSSMNKTIYINDIALSDFNIYCFSDTYLNGPSIDYTSYDIPSRIGSMVQYNKRFNNVERVFSCICSKETYVESLNSLKYILYKNVGYVKLVSDYEPNMYQFGYLVDEIEVKPHANEETITFELRFSCMPQKFYANIEVVSKLPFSSKISTRLNDKFFNEIVSQNKTYVENFKVAFVSGPQYITTENKIKMKEIKYLYETTGVLFSCIYIIENTTSHEIVEMKRIEIDEEITFEHNGNLYFYLFTNWDETLPNVYVYIDKWDGSQWLSNRLLFELNGIHSVLLNENTFHNIIFKYKIQFNLLNNVIRYEPRILYFNNGSSFILYMEKLNELKNNFEEIQGYLKRLSSTRYECELIVDFEQRESYIINEYGQKYSFNKFVRMEGEFYNSSRIIGYTSTLRGGFVEIPNEPMIFEIERWVL